MHSHAKACRGRLLDVIVFMALVHASNGERVRTGDKTSNTRLAAHGNETYKVLSYNICWGCMEADERDNTGMKDDLKQKCLQMTQEKGDQEGENSMGIHLTQCAQNIAKEVKLYWKDMDGYDLMGFQEASNWKSLGLHEHHKNLGFKEHGVSVPGGPPHLKGRFKGKAKKAWVVSAWNKQRLGWYDEAIGGAMDSDKGRPYLVLIFDKAKLMFINVHNCQPGPKDNLKKSWKGFPEEIHQTLKHNEAFKEMPARKDYRVIMTGDFNDRKFKIPGFNLPWKKDARMNLKFPVAKTCCTSKMGGVGNAFGDYIFDSAGKAKGVENCIPSSYNNHKMKSDHAPVQAVLTGQPGSKCSSSSIRSRGGSGRRDPSRGSQKRGSQKRGSALRSSVKKGSQVKSGSNKNRHSKDSTEHKESSTGKHPPKNSEGSVLGDFAQSFKNAVSS